MVMLMCSYAANYANIYVNGNHLNSEITNLDAGNYLTAFFFFLFVIEETL